MINIFGGGTFSDVRSHLALTAPAFGTTAKRIAEFHSRYHSESVLHLTKMADPSSRLLTNHDVEKKTDNGNITIP